MLEEIVEKIENFEKVVEIGDLGLFIFDLINKEVYYFECCFEWLGLEDFLLLDDVLLLIYLDDVEYVSEVIGCIMKGDVNLFYDFICWMRNGKIGEEIYICLMGCILFFDNKLVGVFGIL